MNSTYKYRRSAAPQSPHFLVSSSTVHDTSVRARFTNRSSCLGLRACLSLIAHSHRYIAEKLLKNELDFFPVGKALGLSAGPHQVHIEELDTQTATATNDTDVASAAGAAAVAKLVAELKQALALVNQANHGGEDASKRLLPRQRTGSVATS